MRLLVASPGSIYSTTDVYAGLVAGLRAIPGVDVHEWDTLRELALTHTWGAWLMERAGQGHRVPPPGTLPADMTDEWNEFASSVSAQAHQGLVYTAARLRVDAVILVSAHMVPEETLAVLSLNEDAGGRGICTTAVVYTESPYNDERLASVAKLADLVFTNDRWSAERLGVEYLPMAWDRSRHTPELRRRTGHDVVFVGVGYDERIALLEGIDWTGIDLGLYGDWRNVGPDSPIAPFVHQGIVPNGDAVALYTASKVGLNLFRSTHDYWGVGHDEERYIPYSLNPRSYELAACMVPQVSEWRPEWRDVFGTDANAFQEASGAEFRIRALLSSPDYRLDVAMAQFEAVQAHSYHERAVQLHQGLVAHRERNG